MATAAHLKVNGAGFEIAHDFTAVDARALRSRVHQALQAGEREFVVDCQSWNRLDLLVLSSLVQCATACREHGASFEVANLSSIIQADVRALQLDRRLGLAD